MRRTILSLFNLIHSNVPADCFLNVGEATLPPGWLLCACSEQLANHNEVGRSMGESQNHGCIIRPVYQTCKMAVRQCFSSGHTSSCSPKSIFPRDRNTKKKPKNKTPVKYLASSLWSKSWFGTTLYVVYFSWSWTFNCSQNFLRPENHLTFSRLFSTASMTSCCLQSLSSFWLADIFWCITWVTDAWWEVTQWTQWHGK